MRLVYFARVREAIGVDGEDRALPEDVLTVADCLDWLMRGSANYAAAFGDRDKLRFALDQQMVWEGTALEGAKELAIFPPVTGG
jgi:molybdopterin synthase sulfur carrier subunit